MRRLALMVVCSIMLAPIAVFGEELSLPYSDRIDVIIPETKIPPKESLIINDEKYLDEIIGMQREKDLEDIENLWEGTVSNNQVIAFALKKLATPENQRRIHSSLMSKTLSAMVAGASFLPMFTGQNYMVQSGSFAAGKLAQNLINKKNIPQETPLTDTEMIELAGLVENLQDKIISTYYSYKNSLSKLKEVRTKLLLYGKNYSNALENEDLLEITISSNLYENMQVEEFYYLETAKKYRIELQRLAGKKVVDNLNLVQYNNNILFGQKGGRK